MGGLLEQGLLAHPELLRQPVDADHVGLGEGGDPFRAIAVGPAHMMRALAGNFHEFAQEVLIAFREIHPANVSGQEHRRQFQSHHLARDRGGRAEILIAEPWVIDRPARMGAKYLPTIKDQKAQQRFQAQQNRKAKESKLTPPSPAKKAKRK